LSHIPTHNAHRKRSHYGARRPRQISWCDCSTCPHRSVSRNRRKTPLVAGFPDVPSQLLVAVNLVPKLPQRISVLANALLDQSSRTSLITGHRLYTSSGPTEVSPASTGPFLSNTFSNLAKPPRSPMTSECLLAARLHDPKTSLTQPLTKLSYASTR